MHVKESYYFKTTKLCTKKHVPTPRYGQYLTQAHNRITRAVAAMDSCLALIGAHQYGIAVGSISGGGEPPYQRPFFVFWPSKGRAGKPQGHENKGAKKNKIKDNKKQNVGENTQGKDRQKRRGHLHTKPARQSRGESNPASPLV